MDKYNVSFKNLKSKNFDDLEISFLEKISLIALYGYLVFVMLPQIIAFFWQVEGGLR